VLLAALLVFALLPGVGASAAPGVGNGPPSGVGGPPIASGFAITTLGRGRRP
jgi:hypothetical protein